MSQDEGAAHDRDEGSKAESQEAPEPQSGDPGTNTLRRAKLVLADSQPPPAPDEPIDIDFGFAAESKRPPPSEATDVYLDKVIADKYVVEAYLGRGSMGTVYRCRHRVLDKPFAVKIIRQELARDSEAVSRFVTEAKAASAIGSKHIVEVLDYGELPDGAAYIMMEYLAGCTLYQRLCETPRLPMERTLSLSIQVADALAAAHAAGVVHRDLKPDNVFLAKGGGDEIVKILDFGIAKVLRSQSKLTQAGSVMGTPAYMSPEQAMGTTTDHRTDIYALGIMLYEMASGEVPFDAENPLAVLSMQVTEEPPKLDTHLPKGTLPDGYESVVLKCLAKKPEDRFQDMAEVKEALEKIALGTVPHVVLAPPASKRTLPGPVQALLSSAPPEIDIDQVEARGFRSSRPRWLLPAIGAGAALLIGVLIALVGGSDAPEAAPSASVSVAAPVPPPPVVSAAPIESNLKEVHLILFPLDARVADGKTDLGMMPVTIKLKPGEVKNVQVSRRGYVTRKLIVDGSRPRMVVGLVVEGAVDRGAVQQAERAADEAAAKAAGQVDAKAAPPKKPGAEAAPTATEAAPEKAEKPAEAEKPAPPPEPAPQAAPPAGTAPAPAPAPAP